MRSLFINFIQHTRSAACFVIHISRNFALFKEKIHISSDGDSRKSHLIGNFLTCELRIWVSFKEIADGLKGLILYALGELLNGFGRTAA